ncbi:GntR family transcriptional regulator [Streptomyces sp. NPDC056716]|uniref:FadR/GntR family transcriptional regulator n=1 Tax=Streptomyces sp. NPDC056716 TaxID=3345922 RepID=UPI0036AFFF0B
MYAATEQALNTYSESPRKEVAGRLVRVAVVEAAPVATDLLPARARGARKARKARRTFEHLSPAEVADAVAHVVTCPAHAAASRLPIRPSRSERRDEESGTTKVRRGRGRGQGPHARPRDTRTAPATPAQRPPTPPHNTGANTRTTLAPNHCLNLLGRLNLGAPPPENTHNQRHLATHQRQHQRRTTTTDDPGAVRPDTLGSDMSVPQTPAKIFRGRVADQIVEDLRAQILSGTLPDGSRMPSERELAAYYDVSGPTVREAVRVLTAMGLVNTRNGSRATITAQGDTLLAVSIASVVQVEKVGARETLGLLGALNSYAAELAAEHATDEEIDRLREAAQAAQAAQPGQSGQPGRSSDGVEQSATTLQAFFTVLAEISHNPLLAALCRFLTEAQIGMAVKLSGGAHGHFGRVSGPLHAGRMRIVGAIASRDPRHAATVVREYHREVIQRIAEVREAAGEPEVSETGLTEALTGWLRSNVTLGGQPVPARSTR